MRKTSQSVSNSNVQHGLPVPCEPLGRLSLWTRRFSIWGLLLLFLVCGWTTPAPAQWLKKGIKELKRPLVDGEPFDLLILNKNGEQAVIKVKPLGRNLPKFPLADRGQLVFEMSKGFDEKLEVPYASIDKILTFNQLLVEEADAWINQKKYAYAFRNLLFVYDNGGRDEPGLVSSLRDCMFLDATTNFKNKDFELSLSIYEDIYEREGKKFRPKGFNKPLIEIIMMCYDGMIQKKFDAEDYLTVRMNVNAVLAKYPEDAKPLQKRWEAAFLKRSDELLAASKKFAEKGQAIQAHKAARQANQIVAGRPVVLQQMKSLIERFPMILVGVSQTQGDANPNRMEHWGARRVGRLTQRRMIELVGLSDEGGVYSFLNGTIARMDDAGLKYSLEIEPEQNQFATPPVNAFDVSMRLLQRGQPQHPNYEQNWAKIVDRIFIEDEKQVSFTLRTPFVRPEALLTMPYDDAGTQNGAYVFGKSEAEFTEFVLNPAYEPVPGRQHPVLVEQDFGDASRAVDELIKGNIDVVDRVSSADIAKLKQHADIVVRSYVLPTVHLLIPKIRDESLRDSLNFRSGLSHTINREQIVRDVLCGGKAISGNDALSGPFPIGTDSNDQIAYAYDMRAQPLAFNEKLGMVEIEMVMQPKPPRQPDRLPTPNLVIAHPRASGARNAAEAIARSWSQAGIPTTTRELDPGMTIPEDEDWDFLYFEVVMQEPLADAGKIVGVHGYAKDVSAPIEQTLRLLNYARSWQTACSALRRLHRQIRVDLAVIPLWQTTENYAYRNTIRNVGRNLIHLYQNVDRWEIDLNTLEESR